MNGGTKPIISVCIPTYNRAELLKKALRSILEDFDGINIEVIVSDNASEDNTEEIVRAYQSKYPYLKYYRNETNVGLDDNAVACIRRATGEYVFMFSDDDVLLPGSGKYLLNIIREFKPNLIYLNHRGFWENEDPYVVYRRKTPADREDRIYKNGFDMLLDLGLSHFSAIIFRREEGTRYLHHLEDYKKAGYERGYVVVLANHVALESPPPFVFVGKCCVAVRNLLNTRTYNIVYSTCIEKPRQCQNLRGKNLLSDSQLRRLMNKWVFWPSTRIIVRMKGAYDPRFTKREAELIWQVCKGFSLFYFIILPLLLLPRFTLIVPLCAGLTIQWFYRKITGRSAFE